MKKTALPNGVYVAALTPMHRDLTADTKLLVDHCHQLLDAGAHGLALMGTTGEANSFSVKERKTLIEDILEKGISRDQIMLGTGCCAYTDTIDLTLHAVKHGIKNILLLPPFYYKQINDEGLFEYFNRVVNEVADNELEIYLYHFPKMTGLNFSFSLLEKLIHTFPDTFVGMKDSSGDLEHMKSICHHFPGFRLFAGTEKYLLDTLRMDGAGCISATANVTISKCVKVFNAWKDAVADQQQAELTVQRTIFEGLPFIGILKQFLAKSHANNQWLNVRPPNGLVSAADFARVWSEMHAD